MPQTKQEKKIHAMMNKGGLSSKDLLGLRPEQIPKNAPEAIKICSRCEKSFDINKGKGRSFTDLPICRKCIAKGLKPLGSIPRFVWDKLSQKEKQKALAEITRHDPNNSLMEGTTENEVFAKKDFDDLPKILRNKLRTKFGIEVEK